jgi:hypothetical protein
VDLNSIYATASGNLRFVESLRRFRIFGDELNRGAVPWAVPNRARMLTFAFPSIFATSATAPGRFSTAIVNCSSLAMTALPCAEIMRLRVEVG